MSSSKSLCKEVNQSKWWATVEEGLKGDPLYQFHICTCVGLDGMHQRISFHCFKATAYYFWKILKFRWSHRLLEKVKYYTYLWKKAKKHLGRYRPIGLTSALEKITAELLMISFSRHLNGAKEWGHELYSTLDRPHFKYWMNFGPCNMRETLENWRGFSEGLPRWLED